MKCIIIEDQTPAQRLLKGYVTAVSDLELCGIFSNAIDALEYLKTNDVDVIFLDIHLPKLSGIDFLKSVKLKSKVILTTAFSDYALESYDLEVVDYLLKPFSFPRFLKAISKLETAKEQVSSSQYNNQIFIKSGYEYVKIDLNKLTYIKSDGDYTELFLQDAKYLSSQSLKQWLTFLPDDKFTQIHKSYILNIEFVKKVVGNQAFINEKVVLPIGRAFKDEFINTFISPNGLIN